MRHAFEVCFCRLVFGCMWDGDWEPSWNNWVSILLPFWLIYTLSSQRLFFLLELSLVTARRLIHHLHHLHTTSSTLTLVTRILILSPFIPALSPTCNVDFNLLFVMLIFRLLSLAMRRDFKLEDHLRLWMAFPRPCVGTLVFWFWSCAVARGIMSTTCSSVVGTWYFAE